MDADFLKACQSSQSILLFKQIFWQITPPEYLFLVSALPIQMLKKIFRQASPPEYLFSGLRMSHFGLQKDIPAS